MCPWVISSFNVINENHESYLHGIWYDFKGKNFYCFGGCKPVVLGIKTLLTTCKAYTLSVVLLLCPLKKVIFLKRKKCKALKDKRDCPGINVWAFHVSDIGSIQHTEWLPKHHQMYEIPLGPMSTPKGPPLPTQNQDSKFIVMKYGMLDDCI